MADPIPLLKIAKDTIGPSLRHSLAALLATTALGLVPAHAVDGTWLGNSATPTEWLDGTNWTSNPDLPDGTAIFTNNGASTTVDVNGFVSIGAISFTNTSPAYTININDVFSVNGTGVSNNSAATQIFNVTASLAFVNASSAGAGTGPITYNNGGAISFFGTSTAGNAVINNGAILQFSENSSAGTATIQNNLVMDFFDSASAGSANITNTINGTLTFNGTATAGSATIGNDGIVSFTGSSSGGTSSAHLTNNFGGIWSFSDNSTAGASTFVNDGDLSLNNSAKAGTSDLTNNSTLTFNNSASADHATIANSGQITFNDSASADHASITNNFASLTFADQSKAGNAVITNTLLSAIYFTGNSSADSARITNDSGAGTIFSGSATAGTSAIVNDLGGATLFNQQSRAGTASITNKASDGFSSGGILYFGSPGGTDTSSANHATIVNEAGAFGFGSGGFTEFYAASTADAATITTNANGAVAFLDNSSGGTARFIVNAGGAFDISQLSTAGTTAGSIEGAGTFYLGDKQLTVGGNNLSTTVSGTISDGTCGCWGPGGVGGSLVKVGTGSLTLSGVNTYTGTTSVNAGSLIVDGDNSASSLTTVNAGATLAGSGTVGNTEIAGGTLAPGSAGGSVFGPLAVAGSLSFTAASTYLVQVSPATSATTNVTGAVNLGGAQVSAMFLPGTYVARQYTILSATGGLGGTTFDSTVLSNNANLSGTLSYDPTNVFLNITLNFVTPNGPLTVNQQNVANALTNFFNSTGGIPAAFASLNAAGLTIASGELGTGIIQSATKADDFFLNLLLDPTIAGRAGGFAPVGSTTGFAAEDDEALAYTKKRLATKSERDAYAMARKAPALLAAQPANRWSVWGAGYGGSANIDGNAVVGSNDVTARTWGVVGGADYKVTPNTLLGFALAGGGTNYSLANSLGRGSSELFQAGVFGRHNFGPAYIAGALNYGWHDVTTNRTVTLAGIDQLQARFRAETFSGRFEGGYRYANPIVALTPYAAAQFTSVRLPAYAEQVLAGAGTFALNYAGQITTATRTELGLRTDKSFAMKDGMLTLRGRAAWAHDYNNDRAISTVFQTLPGANFIVNGARPDPDAALVSAGAEMKWLSGFSLAGTFEGEFSGNYQSYAGKGVAKYSW